MTRKEQERDFKRRMKSAAKARKAGAKLKKLCAAVPVPDVTVPVARTPKWKVAKAFERGKGTHS